MDEKYLLTRSDDQRKECFLMTTYIVDSSDDDPDEDDDDDDPDEDDDDRGAFADRRCRAEICGWAIRSLLVMCIIISGGSGGTFQLAIIC